MLPRRRAFDVVLPGLAVLRRYESAWLRADVIAGVTVGAMLIPQSMAYAELADLPPAYGFYASIAALVVYALVGSSRHLGAGPEPGTALLAAAGVSGIAAGDPERYTALMAALALVVAGLCILGALARLGALASLLSKPVLVGYITGVGLTLLSSQITAVTGVAIGADSFFPRIAELFAEASDVDAITVAIGAGALAIIVALHGVAPRVPGALVAIVTTTAVAMVLQLDDHGLRLVGDIPSGLPMPGLPDVGLADIVRLLPVAAGIALVGYSDNVLTARSLAARHGYKIDANQELLALGLTNLASGLSRGFPISSSASRTAVPASLGSKTQLVSLLAATFVIGSLFGLRPLLGEIPRPALAAVIVAAAFSIIDVTGYRALWRVSREEAALALITTLAVVIVGVLPGVVAAVVLSLLLAVWRLARPQQDVIGEPGLVVFRFDAPLLFMNIERFCEHVHDALERNPGDEEWVILDFEGVGAVDATALDALDELVVQLGSMGVSTIAVTRANREVTRRLHDARLLGPVGRLRSFPTILGAVQAYRERAQHH